MFKKNTVLVKDSDGKRFIVSKTDKRYLSGELKFWRYGETTDDYQPTPEIIEISKKLTQKYQNYKKEKK